MNTLEIELRYKALNSAQLKTFVSSLKCLHQKRDIDIYFDTKDSILYQKGVFIRNRNDKKLDFKFNRDCINNLNLPMQDYCEEHSFSLPLRDSDLHKLNELLMSLNLQPIPKADLEAIKEVNQFGIHYVIDKIRTSYQYDSFTLGIDEVADLGTFLEIELMTSSIEGLALIKQQMQQLLKGLDLMPLRTGYGTLLLRKKNFEHYLLGRFILEEDKVYRNKAY